ncbi:MAG TPA: nicotinate-nucleotide--dimethylbenzimidazole phosphoribosyltransferase [Methylomusa anaerophila]|uniref:Nicotinate-nucleotide--dimethylbenzimidazole phosphoribosyltransferase n=1 Tax=Methylomusa anaerophila TaxID=1930071 RepID=A0A348AGA0_9FIRM|nr:nicotinate-nucleotide--dimethylbenzimidazole phosphoribosyltransferase [Methylomusa anaerophila]BBB90098.1 nicotinate-nucleotide--dimethylbenzimidazole phosphoribosyltransferase [Methylomusa anaerophila]HML88177.1 nicotinate-nucleotide--dimethylbenzimidazole phosphoribosyltransferase [Methylomusa anaerophila]
MKSLESIIRSIEPLNQDSMLLTQQRLDSLTKPPGSLAVLEKMACQLAGIQGKLPITLPNKAILLMAADHGVAVEGVSAFPAEVTEQMVYNFVNGGAAINVLARHANARLILVDVGVKADFPAGLPIRRRKIRKGTDNMRYRPAMERPEVLQALQTGMDMVNELADDGIEVIGLGEMGIANTTASSAITSLLAGKPPAQVVGRGTGIEQKVISQKIRVIEEAVARHKPDPHDVIDVLAKVGGLEIAALAGAVLGAAARRILIILDGFISSAAVLAAYRLCNSVQPYLLASHLSEEPGHAAILQALGLEPCIRLNMRLGEGTGAALGMTLLDAAVKIVNEMATFGEAKVAEAYNAGDKEV